MKPLNVLIIEDDEMNRTLMSRYVKKLGHVSTLTNNGNQGIEALKENDFDIVIMDLEMPVMNGYETALQIRNLSDRIKKHIPILAFTGQAYPALQQKAIEAGVDDFVMKPIDFSELKHKLHSYSGIENIETKTIINSNTDTTEIDNSILDKLANIPFQHISLGYLVKSAHGDPMFVNRMIQSFVNKTPKYLIDLQKLVDIKEYDELKTLAHKYKATIVITEVKEVAELIQELENKIIDSRDLDTLPTIVAQICKLSNLALTEATKALEVFK